MSKTKLPAELQVLLNKSSVRATQFLMKKARPQWQGQTSTLVVTEECNLRCTYCYCHKTPNAMTWETAKQYIDVIFEKCLHFADIAKEDQKPEAHKKIFEFIGGEPLLEAKLMFRCMDYIIEKVESLPTIVRSPVQGIVLALATQPVTL